MELVICIIIGFVVGCIATIAIINSKTVGSIMIDGSIPYLCLKSTSDIDVIKRKKYISLKVSLVNDDSQE